MKQQLLALIGRAYEEKLAFIDMLTPEQRAMVGTPEQWSPKDYLAHMLAWDERAVDNHQAALQGVPLPSYGDTDHANNEIFLAHRDMSWEDTRRKVDAVHQKVTAWLDAQTEDDLTDPARFPWLNNRTLWGRIVGNSVIHPLLHLAELCANYGQRDHATAMQESLVPPLLALSDAPTWHSATLYNLACYYALAGLKDKAIAKLGEAFQVDSSLVEWSKEDADLNSLRDDPAYQALYSQRADA
jgi:hypothetical protein